MAVEQSILVPENALKSVIAVSTVRYLKMPLSTGMRLTALPSYVCFAVDVNHC